VFGAGLPWGMIAAGALLGLAIIAFDVYLERSGAKWRMPVLAVAVGVYLPFELAVPMLLGGIVAFVSARRRPRRADPEHPHGVLFAAGLITGEAMIGILMAVPIVLSGDAAVFALPWNLPAGVGLAVVALVAVALYRVAVAVPKRR